MKLITKQPGSKTLQRLYMHKLYKPCLNDGLIVLSLKHKLIQIVAMLVINSLCTIKANKAAVKYLQF